MIEPTGKANFLANAGSPVKNIKKTPKQEIPSGDRVDLQGDKKPGFKERLGKLKNKLMSLKVRTYLSSIGIGGVGLGVLGGLAFGPAGAVCGALAGLAGGVTVGAVMNSPMSWFKSENKKAERVPPGSDVIMNPDIKESGLLRPDVQREIDRTTDSRVVEGNRTTLLKNGVESFPERYRMMENAKHSINLQTLIIHSDETGWKTANLLAKKAKEGVKCRVIYDWVSSADSDPKMFKMMEDAGVKLIAFNPPADFKWHGENLKNIDGHIKSAFKDFAKNMNGKDIDNLPKWIEKRGKKDFKFWKKNNKEVFERLIEYPPLLIHKLNNRWHMKMLTVDGKEAVVGGINIGSEYAYGGTDRRDLSNGAGSMSAECFKDTDVKAEGPVVGEINRVFAENWEIAGGKNPGEIMTENPPPGIEGGTPTRFIKHQPKEKKDENIENWYYGMLGNCKKTAYISNAYFLPSSKKFRKALINAAKRGVDVRVLTNSTETNDLPPLTQAGREFYKDLLKGGVRMYELKKDNPGKFSTLHTKASVFDGEVSTVGSHNLDPRSFKLNNEDTLVIQDKEFGKQMHEMFREDLKMSKEITTEDLGKETGADQLEQWFYGQVMRELL
ncbi:MAG: phosphatidylserine/phosphatidylglycerophosphate/cardiolipin synthase family protein [Candidatus Eremiobacteraeota bacterium]|nr:phosphatidylserine/phosphatidylglycerophosphate/cardiolipin synthase family protein [Candidatus Eremiobacteraeota bacterium]